MTVEENVKLIIDRKFGNVKHFAEKIELPYTTIRSILQRGILNAKLDNVIKIADGLGMKPEDLLTLDNSELNTSIETIYNKLQAPRQKIVYKCAEEQLREQESTVEDNVVPFPPKKLTTGRATAAGNPIDGATEDNNISTTVFNQMDVPSGADEIVTVAGDSMEPTYPEGSQIFVHWQPEIEQGEVAIVAIKDEGVTCKKVYYDQENGKIILRSINENYEDRVLNAEDVRVIGRVI